MCENCSQFFANPRGWSSRAEVAGDTHIWTMALHRRHQRRPWGLWAQALTVLGLGLLSAATCLQEESTAFNRVFVDWDVQKPGCGDLDALIYKSIWAGPWGQRDCSVWVRASCGWIVPGCCPVLWRPSQCPWGCLCWALGLSVLVNLEPTSPLAGRELLFQRSIWLSTEPAPFWPQHFFPLLCSRATKTGWDGYPLLVRSGLYRWECSTPASMPVECSTPASMPGVLCNRVSSSPARAALPSRCSMSRVVMFLQISESVDALRPEAMRLLVCSCDEYKHLQKMPTDISLQSSSECTVSWFLEQNEFVHLSGVWGLRRDPKITSNDRIHRGMG